MKEKKTFVFNAEWHEILVEYPPEIRLEVYDAIVAYAVGRAVCELSPMAKMAFSFIRKELDFNANKYNETVKKRSEAGRRGMESRYNSNKPNTCYGCYDDVTTITDNVNVNVNDNVNDNVNITPLSPSGDKSPQKAKKHKHGTYNNVLLSDKELGELLKLENGTDIIEFYSELKEMKGYSYKSDYLAIKKWGIDAYNERNNKGGGRQQNAGYAAGQQAGRDRLAAMAVRVLQGIGS